MPLAESLALAKEQQRELIERAVERVSQRLMEVVGRNGPVWVYTGHKRDSEYRAVRDAILRARLRIEERRVGDWFSRKRDIIVRFD